MKREIHFRGKNKYNGKWVYGSLFRMEGNPAIMFGDCNIHIDEDSGQAAPYFMYDEVDETSIGQYTGLKDKKGAEIYEDDIVLIYCPETDEIEFAKIVFKDNAWCALSADENYGYYGMHNVDRIEFEVIGNLHDDPDLLTK